MATSAQVEKQYFIVNCQNDTSETDLQKMDTFIFGMVPWADLSLKVGHHTYSKQLTCLVADISGDQKKIMGLLADQIKDSGYKAKTIKDTTSDQVASVVSRAKLVQLFGDQWVAAWFPKDP